MKLFACTYKKNTLTITILSYRLVLLGKKNSHPLARAIVHTKHQQRPQAQLCIFTCANKKYYEFAILYPLYALQSNKDAIIEIGVEDLNCFTKKYSHLIDFYDINYPGKVLYSEVKFGDIAPGSVRFITQPYSEAKYIYIGDVDIFLCEEILHPHLKNIKKHELDYSNIKRLNTTKNKLSGLHFIEYKKMYPICIPSKVNLRKINDEDLLFKLMESKGYKIPDPQKVQFRPLHGLHASFFSRPPLPTITTKDNLCLRIPCWFSNNDMHVNVNYTKVYLQKRYSENIVTFMNHIRDSDIALRRIIQIVDIVCQYLVDNYQE